MRELHRYANYTYCLVDFETSNLNLCVDNPVWECAITLATLKKIIKEEVIYIKWPGFKMSDEAAQITRFWEKEQILNEQGIAPAEALKILDSYLYNENYINVFHNGFGFDINVHGQWRRACGLDPNYSYMDRTLDTNAIMRAHKMGSIIPEDKNELQALMWQMAGFGKTRTIKTSIEALCKEFNIERDPLKAHSALYDNFLLYQILGKIVWEIEI